MEITHSASLKYIISENGDIDILFKKKKVIHRQSFPVFNLTFKAVFNLNRVTVIVQRSRGLQLFLWKYSVCHDHTKPFDSPVLEKLRLQ